MAAPVPVQEPGSPEKGSREPGFGSSASSRATVLQLAMTDPDESVRLHTARHMVSNLQPGELPQVFNLVVNRSLVARMVLAEDLRPYALELAYRSHSGSARRSRNRAPPVPLSTSYAHGASFFRCRRCIRCCVIRTQCSPRGITRFAPRAATAAA